MNSRKREVPSLLELCRDVAIQNYRYITSVTGMDLRLLEPILSRCSLEQLEEIEDCTTGIDLTPLTDKLWKQFYETEFGYETANSVIQRQNRIKISFKWKELYKAKMDEREADLQRTRERLKQSYAESAAQKQSRQIKMTTKIPTPASKRRGGGSSSVTSYKSPLMKKAKIEHLQSCALKNPKTLNNQVMKTGSSSSSSASRRVSSQVSLNNGPDPTIPINNRQLSPGANSLTRPSQASARPTGTANQTRPITVRPTQAYANQRPASGTSNLTRATPARLLCTANQRGTAGTADHTRPTSTPSQLRKPTGTPTETATSSLRRLPANPSSRNRAQNQSE